MMKLLVFMVILWAVDCLFYNGSCQTQDFKLHQNFICNKVIGRDEKFKVLAHLPTINSSSNIFYNPLGAIDDLEIQFMCTGHENVTETEQEVVKFFLSCNDTTNVGQKFSTGCNYKSLNMTTHSWDVVKYDGCKPPSFWSSVHIVSYVKYSHAVLWGCRNLLNDTHEQGAWVLGCKINFSEATKLLDQILSVDLRFTKALTKDFILHNQTFLGDSSSCTTENCAKNLLCKNDAQYSEELD